MTAEAIALLVLRAMGAVWIVGAVFLARQLWANAKLDPMIAALEQAAQQMRGEGAEEKSKIEIDNGRERWLAIGAVLTFASGVAMALGLSLALAFLATAIVHQLAYFIRQRRRELAAPDAAHAAEERPSAQTVSGFYATIILTMLTAWLYYRGALV